MNLRSFGNPLRTSARVSRTGWLVTLALAWTAGCTLIYGDELDKRQCRKQADCDSTAALLGTPLVCRQQACQVPTCTQTADCPGDFVCVEHACVAESTDAGTDAGPNAQACSQDTDCESAEQRCGYDGYCYAKWGCLAEDPVWPTALPKFTYVARVRRGEAASDPGAVGTLSVEACAAGDPTCVRPAVLPEQVTVDPDAIASVPFKNISSAGFTGFIRFESISGGTSEEKVLPTYRHFTSETPLVGDYVEPTQITIISAQTLSLFALLGGGTTEAGTSFAIAQINDCGGRPAPSMSLSAISVPNVIFVPTSSAGPVLGRNETTAEGLGAVGNLPSDKLVVLTLRDQGQQRTITSTLTFVVHGGALNAVTYFPRYGAVQKWLEEAKRQGLTPP